MSECGGCAHHGWPPFLHGPPPPGNPPHRPIWLAGGAKRSSAAMARARSSTLLEEGDRGSTLNRYIIPESEHMYQNVREEVTQLAHVCQIFGKYVLYCITV